MRQFVGQSLIQRAVTGQFGRQRLAGAVQGGEIKRALAILGQGRGQIRQPVDQFALVDPVAAPEMSVRHGVPSYFSSSAAAIAQLRFLEVPARPSRSKYGVLSPQPQSSPGRHWIKSPISTLWAGTEVM
ncbi:MAG: hypothetical protein H6R24_2743 [Proteobacteria bacterium]|nr:hypothetical protein [Pseudomonadota bacterium]